MGGRNGRVAGCDRDLMQVRDDVSYRIKTRHRGLPMLVDDEASYFGVAAPRRTARCERTSQPRIGLHDIESQFGPIAQPGQSLCPS